MAGKQSTYPLYDRILDGRLGDILTGWRAEGHSVAEMAFRLRSEHDIAVAGETIRRWLRDLDDSPAEAAS